MITATQTVEVRFKGTRKGYFLWNGPQDPLRVTEAVIVEADRGQDFGRISAVGETAAKKCGSSCSGCAVPGTETAAEPLRDWSFDIGHLTFSIWHFIVALERSVKYR